ncbi:MAG: hypothetical protein WA393_07655 [Nitrososphaeraceae archaeon]
MNGIRCLLVSSLLVLITSSVIIFQAFDPVVRYAVAQGQVRCTGGNLVSSPSQCPSSDQCPPPSGPGSVVQCSRKEGSETNRAQQESESITPTSNESNSVFIFTDKLTYEKGQIVKITVQNNSTEPFRIDNPKAVAIKNLQFGEKYSPSTLSKSKILPPGSSIEFEWNQHDRDDKQVSSGNYSSSVSVRSLRANTSFAIS